MDTYASYSPTKNRARALEIKAARGLSTQALERKQDLQRAVDDLVRGLRLLADCNPDKDRMCDLVGYLIDEANNIDGQCLRDITNAGDIADPVNLEEADELWMRVRK